MLEIHLYSTRKNYSNKVWHYKYSTKNKLCCLYIYIGGTSKQNHLVIFWEAKSRSGGRNFWDYGSFQKYCLHVCWCGSDTEAGLSDTQWLQVFQENVNSLHKHHLKLSRWHVALKWHEAEWCWNYIMVHGAIYPTFMASNYLGQFMGDFLV